VTTVGVALPQLGPVVTGPLLCDFAQEAERMGFDHLWVQDHFLYALEPEGRFGGSAPTQPDVYRSVYAPTEVLAAVASWTRTIELGTSVLVGGNHWPAQLAARLATVDRIAGGRLGVVGLGAGWSYEEHRAVGVDPRTRGRRMDEFVPALLTCWGPDPAEYHGELVDVPRGIVSPKPVTPFRLMSGMQSAAGLARTAAQYDLWNPGSMPVPQVQETLAAMNAQRPPGRDPLGVVHRIALESVAGARLSIDELAERAADSAAAGFEAVILETNYCREIETEQDWLALLAALRPALEAART
jgi:probable F420-dependent oxidoreductase